MTEKNQQVAGRKLVRTGGKESEKSAEDGRGLGRKTIKDLIDGILAGVMIGIGGTVFLSLENKVLGAIFFAIGLFIIVTRGLNLFTGKVGYVFERPASYVAEVLMALVGNFIGTFLVGWILSFTRFGAALSEKAGSLVAAKTADEAFSLFILAIFCGILMFLAVDSYKNGKDNFMRYAAVFLGVIVFILCGFEHSIADMFYIAMAGEWNFTTLGIILVIVLGNAVGGVLLPVIFQLKEKLLKTK